MCVTMINEKEAIGLKENQKKYVGCFEGGNKGKIKLLCFNVKIKKKIKKGN